MTERRIGRDRRRVTWRTVARDLWLVAITGLVVFALLKMASTIHDVQEGRRQAVAIACASTSAVIDAGRATITGSSAGFSPEFERNLRKLGYPPKHVRERQSRLAARAYAASIAKRIQVIAHVRGVVRPDGSLNCHRVQRLSLTGP